MIISASIVFGKSFSCILDDMKELEEKKVPWFHIDFSDGQIAPFITFGPMVIKSLREATENFLEVHALVKDPRRFALELKEAGVDAVLISYESEKSPQVTLREIRKLGMKAGLAIALGTDVSVARWMLPDMDILSLEGVYPGYTGQQVSEEFFKKIRLAKTMLLENSFENIVLEACGASLKNIAQMLDAGADVIVSGKDLLTAPSIAARVDEYQRQAGQRKKSPALELAETWRHAQVHS